MTLTLTVRNAGTLPGEPMPPYEVAGDMIVVGRSRNCDWALPDPTNAISSRHCELRRDGDAWLLKDISTNGTYLNGAATRLTEEHRLAEGDLIRIGHYEILASLGEAKTVIAPAATPAPAPEPAPAPAAEPAPPPAPPPPAEPEPVQDNLTMMWDSMADMNKVDWAKGGFGVRDAAPLVTDLATVEGLVRQLIDAAALGETEVSRSPELISRAGALLKRLVAGLLVMVEARARAKAQMGAEMTGFELEGNNPIKFARSPEQALAQLLNPPQPGFMPADRAVEDAFLDLQSHQVATLKAIPGALRATLDRFSPGSIRRRRGDDLGFLAKLFPAFRDAALWRHYEREFVAVKKESDDAFMEVFAKEFRKAYERQLRDGIK
jgi:predicted component of type VI protein secretion system